MSKAANSKAVADAVKVIASQMVTEAGYVETQEDIQAARNAKKNTKGEMLRCDFTLQKQEGRADPLCITVNDEIKWVKRGKPVKLPWYFVEHMLHNQDRKYRQEKDTQGKNFITYDDVTSEPFQYRAIDPAINEATGQPFEIEGPRAPVAAPY